MAKQFINDGQAKGNDEVQSYKKLLGKYYHKVFNKNGAIIIKDYDQAEKVTEHFKKHGKMDSEAAVQLIKEILTRINNPIIAKPSPKACTPLRDLFKRDNCQSDQ